MNNETNEKDSTSQIKRWDMNDEQWGDAVNQPQEMKSSQTRSSTEGFDSEVSLTKYFRASLAFFSVTVISSLLLFIVSKNETLLISLTWMTLGAIWLVPFIFGVCTVIAFINEFTNLNKDS